MLKGTKKLSEEKVIGGFSLTESALITVNNLPILNRDEFNEYFPDLLKEYKYPRFVLKDLSKLIGTDLFIDKLNSFNKSDKICLASDYDADGIVAAAIMGSVLKTLGYENISISIPNRLEDHYGIKLSDIDDQLKAGTKLFITSDNGISEGETCKKIKDAGADVIVTDHHLPSGSVPENCLIIDPAYNNDEFPGICGAVVVLKLAYALYLSQVGSLSDIYLWDTLVGLAGIATITDAMPMIKENRLIVRELLNQIGNKSWELNHILTGFGANREVREIYNGNKRATEDLIAFTAGPSINAISRVNGDVVFVVETLIDYLTKKINKFPSFVSYNYTRKDEANELMDKFLEDERGHDSTPIVYAFNRSDYAFNPKGIYGIVANKSSDIFGAVSLIGSTCDNGTYEFSGRSPDNYDLHAGVERIKSAHPELEISGGGHAMAMGIRLPNKDAVDKFTTLLTEDYNANKVETNSGTLYEFDDDAATAAVEMYNYKPFGNSFEKLTFCHRGVITADSEPYMFNITGLPCKCKCFIRGIDRYLGKSIKFTFVPQYDENTIYYKIEKIF